MPSPEEAPAQMIPVSVELDLQTIDALLALSIVDDDGSSMTDQLRNAAMHYIEQRKLDPELEKDVEIAKGKADDERWAVDLTG